MPWYGDKRSDIRSKIFIVSTRWFKFKVFGSSLACVGKTYLEQYPDALHLCEIMAHTSRILPALLGLL